MRHSGFVLLSALVVLAACQTPVPKHESSAAIAFVRECPNPVVEDMSWRLLEGTAVTITGGNSFTLHTTDGSDISVVIANIADGGPSETLQQLIGGKRVTVLINPSTVAQSRVEGDVHVDHEVDVARILLSTGAARFIPAEPYTVSAYAECLHRIAERDAKAAHRGVWSSSQ